MLSKGQPPLPNGLKELAFQMFPRMSFGPSIYHQLKVQHSHIRVLSEHFSYKTEQHTDLILVDN